jgi:rhodanese-related sulfurtransferase
MGKDSKEESPGGTVLDQLPQEKRDELTRALEQQVLAPRTIIFRQGDPGDLFYIIQSGKVRVFRKDSAGLETDLSVLGEGQSFGEMALLTGEVRSANVETIEETRLMVLSREQFEHALRDVPGLTLSFVKQMSGWLLRDEKIIEKEARLQREAPRLSPFDFILLIGVSLIIAFLFNGSNPNGISPLPNLPDRKAISTIRPANAMEDLKKGDTVMVDAGPEGFYQRKHIHGAINVPLALSDILYEVTFQEDQKGKKVIVYGGTFSKSYDWDLAAKLVRRGLTDVKVLEGGTTAWVKAGYPVDIWEEKK